MVAVGKRGEHQSVHSDLPRQHSFGTTFRFTGSSVRISGVLFEPRFTFARGNKSARTIDKPYKVETNHAKSVQESLSAARIFTMGIEDVGVRC